MHIVTDGSKLRAMGEERLPAGAFARHSGGSLRKAERGEPVELATARKIGAALDVDPRMFARAISGRPALSRRAVSRAGVSFGVKRGRHCMRVGKRGAWCASLRPTPSPLHWRIKA